MRNWRNDKLTFGVLLLPPSVWLILFFTLPLLVVWVYSFATRGPLGEILLDVSFQSYVRSFDWVNLAIIGKSLRIAFLATALCLIIGFPLALGIAFAPAKYKNVLLLLVILPFWTNLLIRTYAWIAILRTQGFVNFGLEWVYNILNSVFTALGMTEGWAPYEPLQLLYNEYAVIVGIVYVNLPFLILPLYASLEKLDRSYLEASLDLGAGQWRTLFSVTAPLALPGITTGLLLTFILALGSYLTPDLLGGPDGLMVGNLIARQFGAARDWPFGSALSFLLMYATFVFLWLKAVIARRKGVVNY